MTCSRTGRPSRRVTANGNSPGTTAGTGSDYTGISYLAMGMTATPQNAALDVDFVGYKLGAHFPPGFAEPPGGWDYRYDGDELIVGAANSGFTSRVSGS